MAVIKVYVNWADEEIISSKDIGEKVHEIFQDRAFNEDEWNNWLEYHYSKKEIFDMNEDEKVEALSKFRRDMMESAREDVENAYEEFLIRTENFTIVGD